MEAVKKNLKKAGRPLKDIKKDIRACVRMSRSEHFIIKEKARKAGRKTSEYIRLAAIQARILSRLTQEEMDAVRQLIGMSNNMNQVAKICHRDGLLEALSYFENYRNRVDNLLTKLKS